MAQAFGVGGWLVALIAIAAGLIRSRALAVRTETLVRACHEVRGPITAARLGVQLGLRSGGLANARLRAIDLELGRATLALGELAVTSTRLGQARELGLVRIGELLGDSVEAWQAAALEQGVCLALDWADAEASLWGDRLRLAQATGNLIANAIEHGGGVVNVSGRVEGSSIRVEVSDDGPGLPAPVAEIARRAHRRRGARGRGLAIAAAVAEEHGGRLAAGPSESGARLVLELPARLTQR